MLTGLLVGCASGPGGKGPGLPVPAGTPPDVARLPPPVARHPDRDGPPLEVPPNLAQLPDAVPQIEPIRPGGANKPYVVLGQAYEPTLADAPFKQRGLASWYGTKFHGRKTASGELFSIYALTAAHRTLPIPSYARVRSVATGKEVIVRINDRGPFHSQRVLDLSYAAAVKLGISGTSEVEIERLTFDEIRSGAWRRGTPLDPEPSLAAIGPTPLLDTASVLPGALPASEAEADPVLAAAGVSSKAPPPDEASDKGAAGHLARAYTTAAKGYWVQLAALGRRDGVEKLQTRVGSELQALAPMLAVFHEAALFKLQVGPYDSREQAQAAARQAATTLQIKPMVVERR